MAEINAGYKRTLTGDGQGFRYETKMTALAALRLYNNSDEFYLASNFEKGDKFDDIVFTFRKDNQWSTWFIQLKHKQVSTLQKNKISVSTLRSRGQDFLIRKYLDSYKAILGKFRVNGDDVIFGKPSENSRYLIYTNACFNDQLVKRNHETVDVGLLSTNPQKELNIKFDCTKDDDILSGMMGDPKLFQFIDKLVFCSSQASEDSIDELIQCEIKTNSNELSNVELKYITHQLCDYIYTWCKTGKYLTKKDVATIILRNSLEIKHDRNDESLLTFTQNFLKFVENGFGHEKLIFLGSKAESTKMCMAALKQMGLMDEPNKLVTLKQLESLSTNEVVAINTEWSNRLKTHRTLVVDCECEVVGINKDKIVRFLKDLMTGNPNNRIILVAVLGHETTTGLSNLISAKQRKFNCSLKDLTEDSRSILMEREVLFQGYKTPLRSLMPNNKTMDDVTDMASMTQLIQGRAINVGIKPVEHIPYYVTRVLTRYSSVSSDTFANLQIGACIALSGITLDRAAASLPSSCVIISSLNVNDYLHDMKGKIVILEGDPETDFEAISRNEKNTFHWFEKSKRSAKLWQWRKSTKMIQDVSLHLENQLDYVATDNIMDIKDNIVVITAEPGMGKSTLLEHLAAETKRMCPHLWVILLTLNDYTEHFDNPHFIRNAAVCAKSLIAAAAGVDEETSKFNFRLFNQCYDVTGNMIVLMDGFDEITPYYTEQGLALIDSLRKSAVIRVWVTARPVLQEKLENATSTLSYTIKPFETKDQKNFLHKFWKNELPSIDVLKLKEFINRILNLIDKSFDNKLNQFTGIPLQTRMLAEVFQGDIRTYHETGTIFLKDQINGVQLFQEFIRIKSGIQMDKAKITVTNAIAMYDQKRLSDAREQDLIELALLTLLPRNVCADLVPPITAARVLELKELVSQGNEKSGIVLAFKGETPQFIHRTFAEYFAGLYFSKHFMENRKFLSTDYFFDESFEFVLYFFDRLLIATKELHEAVLDRNMDNLIDALESGVPVDDLDAGGRSPLHLCAVIPDSEPYITSLIAAGANVNLEDNVLGWRPLQYAVKVGAVNNIAPLLENSLPSTLEDGVVPVTGATLLEAVRGDYLQLLIYLLDNGIFSVENAFDLSPQKWLDDTVSTGLTILHLAAAYNACKILKYFLRKDIRDSKALLIESKTPNGFTPLLLAGSRRCFEAVELLIDAGANCLVTSSEGKNLPQFAVETQNMDMLHIAVKYAVGHNVPVSSFLTMAVTSLISDKSEWGLLALQVLLSFIPAVGKLSTTKGLPLLVASAIKGNVTAVRSLCKSGSDVNIETDHGTPLHLAVAGGHEEVVRELLACSRTVVDVRDKMGWTPLLKAVSKGYPSIFQLLIDAGADVTCRALDDSDLTHLVSQSCDESIFFYALESGFDFNKKNSAGETGLSLLEKAGAISLVNILVPPKVEATMPVLEPESSLPLVSHKLKENRVKQIGIRADGDTRQKQVKVQKNKNPAPKNLKKKNVKQAHSNSDNTEMLLNMVKDLALNISDENIDFGLELKSILGMAAPSTRFESKPAYRGRGIAARGNRRQQHNNLHMQHREKQSNATTREELRRPDAQPNVSNLSPPQRINNNIPFGPRQDWQNNQQRYQIHQATQQINTSSIGPRGNHQHRFRPAFCPQNPPPLMNINYSGRGSNFHRGNFDKPGYNRGGPSQRGRFPNHSGPKNLQSGNPQNYSGPIIRPPNPSQATGNIAQSSGRGNNNNQYTQRGPRPRGHNPNNPNFNSNRGARVNDRGGNNPINKQQQRPTGPPKTNRTSEQDENQCAIM